MQSEHATEDFERRRSKLLRATAGHDTTPEEIADPTTDVYANRAMANLALDRHVEAANDRIRHTAEWFDHPHPNGRAHDGECDFAAQKLMAAWYRFDEERLEPRTRDRIRRFFLTTDFESRYTSENHGLLFRTSRYLMAKALPDETFEAYGVAGADLIPKDREWIERFVRYRARRGWGEFDSAGYLLPDWDCLICLHDCSDQDGVRQLATNMLDLLLADMAVDSLNGMYCGAHGRINSRHARDHTTENTYPLQFLYFGDADLSNHHGVTSFSVVTSRYEPSELVRTIALHRNESYENRERKHLHNTEDLLPEEPLPGSIRKYTWWTPEYVMGAVQYQDSYPEDCAGAWYAHHEQHEWDLSIGTGPRTRLFTHHPGENEPQHGYWTGDTRCDCGHFFQHTNALVGLYDIPSEEPYQLIHAYVPRDEFEETREENGWIFVREAGVCAGLRMLGDHQWTTEGEWKNMEVRSPGAENGVVCEVGLVEEFGTFEAFRETMMERELEFDRDRMNLRYHSPRVGELEMDIEGGRWLNGDALDLEYPLYDNPYMYSDWDSGVIRLAHEDLERKLDFRTAENPTQ